MKKWLAFVLILCIAGAVHAEGKGKQEGNKEKGKSDITKSQFIEKQKAKAEKMGEEFDQVAAEAKFDEMDKNKDGVLTADEKGMGKKKGQDKGEGKKSKGEQEEAAD